MYKVGDIVTISKDATYWDGRPIPEYITRIPWIISSISNDRVLLGLSANGTVKLDKPIHQKFLQSN